MGRIALLHVLSKWCDCIMRSGEYGAFSLKGYVPCVHYEPSGSPLPPSVTQDYMEQILKKENLCGIVYLMPFTVQCFIPFLCHLYFSFIYFSLPFPLVFASPGPVLFRRESFISRMKVLSPFGFVRKVMAAAQHLLLIFSSLTTHRGAIIPCSSF